MKVAEAHPSDSNAPTQTIEVAQTRNSTVLTDTLRSMSKASGRTYGPIVMDYIRTANGPGQLTFDEFVALRLWDPAFLGEADRRAFVGLKMMRVIWTQANFVRESIGLMQNKIAANALLSAYGFSVIPTLALFHVGAGMPGSGVLRSPEDFAQFLRDPDIYPLFGKPLGGYQSLGSASFGTWDPTTDTLVRSSGEHVKIETFVAEVATNYGAGGYLLQRRLSPAASVQALCGDRLATVRLITIVRDGQPKILRACWKVPAAGNSVDNYWRPGNLLLQIDPDSGLIGRAMSGKGIDLIDVTNHPDTGVPLVGGMTPNWSAIVHVAIEAARVMKDFGLVGWDIAPVDGSGDGGAVIVEMNETPDLMLPQLADRRGILDDEFRSFLAERKAMHTALTRAARASVRQDFSPSFWAPPQPQLLGAARDAVT